MARTSFVTVEEQTGRRRLLQLRGGGLPLKGAQFPSKMRLSTTWMPGAGAEAVQQVVGFAEGDPEWEGYWSTPTLASEPCLLGEGGGSPQPITIASTLFGVLESIMASGSKLTVTWSQDGDVIARREGRIEELTPSYRTRDDVEWHLKWAWTGRGNSSKRVVSLRKDRQLAQHKAVESELNNLTAQLAASKFISSRADLPGSATSFSLGQLEGFVDSLKDFTGAFARQVRAFGDRIRQVGELAQSIEELPADVAQQFVDAAASVQSACVDFSDAVSRRGPEAYARLDRSSAVLAAHQVSKYLADSKAAADATALACSEARSSLLARGSLSPGGVGGPGRASPDAVSFTVARQGDTFASVAKKKLGDPGLGPAVAKASGYTWLDVEPRVGSVLVVPSARAAAALMPGA